MASEAPNKLFRLNETITKTNTNKVSGDYILKPETHQKTITSSFAIHHHRLKHLICSTAQRADRLVDPGFRQTDPLRRLAVVTEVGAHAIRETCVVAVPSSVLLGDAGRVALGIVALPFEGLASPFA